MTGFPDLKDADRVLVVEGYSDLLFYAEVLESMRLHDTVFIKQFNGKADLTTQLEVFITPDLMRKRAIGVIVDADQDAGATLLRLQGKLQELTQRRVSANGAWDGEAPRVGLFVTPDGTSPGEIETLVWRAWSTDPINERAKQCVESFRDCMRSANLEPHSPDKALIGALLAIRNDEDPRLGPGARAKVFDFGRPEFVPLRQFLEGLRV